MPRVLKTKWSFDIVRDLLAGSQCRYLVAAIRSSPQCHQEFKRRATKVIPLDNSTRWNSWWLMIHTLLKYRKEVISFQDDYWRELKADALQRSDWEELQEYHPFLKPF